MDLPDKRYDRRPSRPRMADTPARRGVQRGRARVLRAVRRDLDRRRPSRARHRAVAPGPDYAVFWSASYVMLHGSPWQAYDLPTFSRLAAELFPQFRREDLVAWLYPPTNLLLVTPLALLPYAVGYPLFVAFGIVVFGFAAARIETGALPGLRRVGAFALLAAPCVFVTGMFGQNAFLTASCAALAVCWADRRPMWAGLCIGLLSAKPQMALLFPFVLVATRAGARSRGRAHHRRVHRIEHPDLRRRIATPVRRRHGARAHAPPRARHRVLARVAGAVRRAPPRGPAAWRRVCRASVHRGAGDRRRVHRVDAFTRRPLARGGAGRRHARGEPVRVALRNRLARHRDRVPAGDRLAGRLAARRADRDRAHVAAAGRRIPEPVAARAADRPGRDAVRAPRAAAARRPEAQNASRGGT